MGSGSSSRSKKDATSAKVSPHYQNGLSSSADCGQLEDIAWLRLKIDQEKKEKEWIMSRVDSQACASPGAATFGGSSASVVRLEEDVIWLRKAFDAEKTEKMWMMARVDAVEAKLQTKVDEISVLRSQLVGRQSAQPESPFAQGHTTKMQDTTMRSPLSPNVVKEVYSPTRQESTKSAQPESPFTQGQTTKMQKTHPDAVTPLSPTSPAVAPLSPTLSLKERRGLKLQVTTAGLDGKVPASSMERSPLVIKEEEKVLGPSKSEEMVHSAAPTPTNGASTYSVAHPEEPMSPLLLRRKTKNQLEGPHIKVPVPVTLPLVQEQSPLKIQAFKVSALEECPSSPKRARKKGSGTPSGSKQMGLLVESPEENEGSPITRHQSSFF